MVGSLGGVAQGPISVNGIFPNIGPLRAAFETVARAARSHGKAMGVGGVRRDFEFQSWLIGIGMRYLTGGSDVGYILSAGRADVKQLRELKLP